MLSKISLPVMRLQLVLTVQGLFRCLVVPLPVGASCTLALLRFLASWSVSDD